MLEDNNDFALALVMNVPLLWYLGLSERRIPLLRRATQVAVVLTVVTVVLTHSRGGFLSLCATALWIAWRSGKLVRASLVLVTLGLLFPLVAPQHVLDRLGSISSESGDSSINARYIAWQTAGKMIEANPMLGVGMRNFQTSFLEYSIVPPSEGSPTYVAHNSYLQIWAESGTPAFLVYLVLLASVFVVCRRVFRLGRQRPDMAWAADYARMMEATTAGFLVGAFFLNRGHFDLIYHWLALVSCLAGVAFAIQRRAPEPVGARAAGRSIEVRRRGPAHGGASVAVATPAASVSWRRPGRWR
jgi:probable O-glycosylation ligase (exosortase A-associated)